MVNSTELFADGAALHWMSCNNRHNRSSPSDSCFQELQEQDAKPCCRAAEGKRQLTSMQSMQLQALRTELSAAEATVAELKRLIAELEAK